MGSTSHSIPAGKWQKSEECQPRLYRRAIPDGVQPSFCVGKLFVVSPPRIPQDVFVTVET
jgi:hypothetical protein